MDKQFDAAAKDCPGADKCRTWQLRQECKECPRGESPPREIDAEFEEEICGRIERLTLERSCGFPLNPAEVLAEEKELLIVWERREREHSRVRMGQFTETAAVIKAFVEAWGGKKNG